MQTIELSIMTNLVEETHIYRLRSIYISRHQNIKTITKNKIISFFFFVGKIQNQNAKEPQQIKTNYIIEASTKA